MPVETPWHYFSCSNSKHQKQFHFSLSCEQFEPQLGCPAHADVCWCNNLAIVEVYGPKRRSRINVVNK